MTAVRRVTRMILTTLVLATAACGKVFTETASGAKADRPP